MIELLRVELRIVGLRRDDEGRPTGEVTLGEGAAYAAGLDDIPAEVRNVVAEANQPDVD